MTQKRPSFLTASFQMSSRNLYIFKLYTIQCNSIFAVKVEFNSSQPGVAESSKTWQFWTFENYALQLLSLKKFR